MLEFWMIMQNKMQHFLSIWDINGFKWHKIIWFCIFFRYKSHFYHLSPGHANSNMSFMTHFQENKSKFQQPKIFKDMHYFIGRGVLKMNHFQPYWCSWCHCPLVTFLKYVMIFRVIWKYGLTGFFVIFVPWWRKTQNLLGNFER